MERNRFNRSLSCVTYKHFSTRSLHPVIHFSLALMMLLAFFLSLLLTPDPLAFTHVNVIDVRAGTVQTDMTLLVDGERIVAVGPAQSVAIPSDAQMVDATGKYAMPGLWDMHIHPDDPEMWKGNPTDTEKERFLAPMIAYGITGARDMGGDLRLLLDWKRRIAAGSLVGPRLVVGGPLVDGPEPMWPGSVAVHTPDQARRTVDSLQQAGVDFIKIYSLLPRDAFFALAERARANNILFVGHIPTTVSPLEAAEAGMADLEHMVTFSLREFANPTWEQAYLADLSNAPSRLDYFKARTQAYDTEKAMPIFERIAALGTWVVPTLEVTRANTYYEKEHGTSAVENYLHLVPPHVRRHWLPENNPHVGNRSTSFLEAMDMMYTTYVEMMGDMHRAGLRFLPGTDIGGNVHLFPGLSLHRELTNFVEAGLTPAEALRTATYNPAIFLGLEDELGTIEAGKFADLLFTEQNPLTDIRHTQSVWATVANGTYYSRSDLDALLSLTRED